MTQLPDLDTSNVGWFAYYNVINNTDVVESDLTGDNGGPSELESMISDSNSENIDYYDNGVIVTYNGPTRTVTIRFKTDGWITAHMDRTKNYRAKDESGYGGIDGVHDIVHWNDDVRYDTGSTDASESSLVTNTLERSINTGLRQMSVYDTKISSPYNPNDVSLYNYEFQTNNVTLLSDAKIGRENVFSYDFQYTESTDVQHVAIAVSQSGYNTDDRVYSETEGRYITTNPNSGSEWGAIDATTAFQNLGDGVPYQITAESSYTNDAREFSLHVIVVWS